jgi:hypothetical protein
MNLPRDWTLPILLNLAAAFLYGLFLEPLVRAVRAACLGLCRRLRSRGRIAYMSGRASGTGAAYGMLSAQQPPSPLPQSVNNRGLIQWEAYQRHHDLQARFAMASTMPRFPPALLLPPPVT